MYIEIVELLNVKPHLKYFQCFNCIKICTSVTLWINCRIFTRYLTIMENPTLFAFFNLVNDILTYKKESILLDKIKSQIISTLFLNELSVSQCSQMIPPLWCE